MQVCVLQLFLSEQEYQLIRNYIFSQILHKMIEYFISILILLGLFVFYKFYYSPKRALLWYQSTLQGLGYKVKMLPFTFLGAGFYEDLVKCQEKHGDALYSYKTDYPKYDMVIFNTLGTPVIEIYNPELMKSFFLPENIYVHHKMKFIIQNIQRSLGMGIAFSEDKEWKRKRNIMNAVFNYDFITDNIPKIIRICNEALQLSEQECKARGDIQQKDGKVVYKYHVFEIFAAIFSNVMLECFFGSISTHEKIKDQSIATFINTLNTDLNKQGFQLTTIILGTKFLDMGLRKRDRDINNRIKILRQFAKQSIEKRLEELEKTGPRQRYQDIIEALVYKKTFGTDNTGSTKVKFNKKQVDSYDYKELTQEFCTFFTGGTDTTSHFAEMMVYYISQNSQIEEKLRKQIDEVIKSDEDITKENLKKLTYIDWIQNQTTRYYGPGTGVFTRIAQKDHYIANIPILKGTGVNIQPVPNHYNEKYYKNPMEFRPERWESQCDKNHPYAFGGFSGGPRTCIGKHLAFLESKIALIKFVKRYKSFKPVQENIKMVSKFMYEPQLLEFYTSQ